MTKQSLCTINLKQEPNEHFDLGLDSEILLPAARLKIDALRFDEIKDLAKLLKLVVLFHFLSLNLAVYPHDKRDWDT